MTDSLAPAPIDHYENFPVASWLCPPALRAPIAAIYAFARTADDIADEGNAPAQLRLDDLAAYRRDLLACTAPGAPDVPAGISARWPQVFKPLGQIIRRHALPLPLLEALLDAFEQDVRRTRDQDDYADRAQLLDYCARSANPVGRLLLHLYGIDDARALARSDAVCSALQLINFWQDLSVDLPRGRRYLPVADLRAHGMAPGDWTSWPAHPKARALLRDLVAWARRLMDEGAPLALQIPGRAGWELRAVVQGGLRILDKIEAAGFDSWQRRPVIGALDAPRILWRCLAMRAS